MIVHPWSGGDDLEPGSARVKVLGIVTARAGSKGIPGKNTRLLGGKPLIAQRSTPRENRSIRSSHPLDGRRAGGCDRACAWLRGAVHAARVAGQRRRSASAGHAARLDVAPRSRSLCAGLGDDSAAHLAASTAISRPRSRGSWRRSGADSVVSVDELPPHFNPMRAVTIDEDGWARLFVGDLPVKRRPGRRQDMPNAWILNGAIYLFQHSPAVRSDRTEPVRRQGGRVHMTPPYGLNIDDPADWATVEHALDQTTAR